MGCFFGFGEDLEHFRYNVRRQVGFSGRVSASFPRCRLESSPIPPPESILALVESLDHQRQTGSGGRGVLKTEPNWCHQGEDGVQGRTETLTAAIERLNPLHPWNN